MESTRFLPFCSVFHQKPMALRPSHSTAENLPEEKRLLCPKGSWQKVNSLISKYCCSSSPSHLLTAHQPGLLVGFEPHKNEWSRSGSHGPRSRAMNTGICTESTIPTRGRETQPFGLKPIILYRNRTLNIYI